MAVFWMLALVMIGAALLFALVPLLRQRSTRGPSRDEVSLAVLRGQRREIEQDVATGTLHPGARDEALAELATRAESDLAADPGAARAAESAGPLARPWLVAAITAVAVPVVAIGLYLALGNPAALDPAPPKPDAPFTDQQVVTMVENLAKKVRDRPDDVQGWALLARSMGALGRHAEASEAYAHLAKLMPSDASVLADYADSLAMAGGRNLSGKPYELVKQALVLDPRHAKALALAGTASLNEGDFKASLAYWERLAATLPAGTEEATRVQAVLEEVRDRAKGAGKPLPSPGPVAKAAAPVSRAPGTSVSGQISIAPELASKAAPGDTLFIYARAEGGPRMPLAIIRASAKELPRAFELDDSMAMAPAFKLSATENVRIEARVSKSGNATAQPGDLTGTSGVVKPGARGVKVLIDRQVP